MLKKMAGLLCGLLMMGATLHASATLEFANEEERYAYEQFIKEFRCVTCPNQSISDSSAVIAQAMREEIYRRYQQGESFDTIRDYLLQRYGDYVLYKPLVKKETWLLWFAPFI